MHYHLYMYSKDDSGCSSFIKKFLERKVAYSKNETCENKTSTLAMPTPHKNSIIPYS